MNTDGVLPRVPWLHIKEFEEVITEWFQILECPRKLGLDDTVVYRPTINLHFEPALPRSRTRRKGNAGRFAPKHKCIRKEHEHCHNECYTYSNPCICAYHIFIGTSPLRLHLLLCSAIHRPHCTDGNHQRTFPLSLQYQGR